MVMDEKDLFLGVLFGTFYGAARCWSERERAAKALFRISAAPCGRVSDLRSLLLDNSSDDDSADGRLVVLRGYAVCSPVLVVDHADSSAASPPVLPSAAPSGPLDAYFNALLLESLSRIAQPSSDQVPQFPASPAVFPSAAPSGPLDAYFNALLLESFSRIAQPSSDQCLQWNRDIRKDKGYRFSVELVPYALVDGDQRVFVTQDKTRPVPLQMVNHLQSPSYPSISSLQDYKNLVAMCNRERHVTIEKEITAVGICRNGPNGDGPLQIESCRRLPYFVTDLTKDEIETRLAETSDVYLWATITLGALNVIIFGFGLLRFAGDRS